MIKQKEAVVNAVAAVMKDSFISNQTIVHDVITADQKKAVCDMVTDAILAGEVSYEKQLNPDEVSKYVRGMVDNHLRRAKELNGDISYKPSKEGVKRDPQLRELNRLLSTCGFQPDSDQYKSIVEHIDQRKVEIQSIKKDQSTKAPKKTKQPEIDVSILPPHLASLLQE